MRGSSLHLLNLALEQLDGWIIRLVQWYFSCVRRKTLQGPIVVTRAPSQGRNSHALADGSGTPQPPVSQLLRETDANRLRLSSSGEECQFAIGSETVEVLVFGSINMDIKARANSEWPESDYSDFGQLTYQAGGKGMNEAVAIARLGVHTSMVGRVGDDEHGSYLKSELIRNKGERAQHSSICACD